MNFGEGTSSVCHTISECSVYQKIKTYPVLRKWFPSVPEHNEEMCPQPLWKCFESLGS